MGCICKTCQKKSLYCVFDSINNFRLKNGLAGVPGTIFEMKMQRNAYLHYTKESLLNGMHTSYIVPKGSPLKVSQIHVERNI